MVGGDRLTFAQWDTAATRLARGLVEAGVRPGDRVALHLEAANALRWMIAYAAVHRAGAVAVPFNPQLTRPEVARMLAPLRGGRRRSSSTRSSTATTGAATPLVVAVPRPGPATG